ncbi:MAG: DUF424 family protein [Candidatus Pacearchaeota archaeon]
MPVLVKIHDLYRKIVAVCDTELLGKKFEEENLQLDVNEKFYGGKEFKDDQVIKLLKDAQTDDACFNFVGENSIALGVKAGIIDKNCVIKIQNIPHAMALL